MKFIAWQQSSLFLAAAAAAFGPQLAHSAKCGDPWREECLSETDKRYKPNANYDIKAQHELYAIREGYFECDMYAYGPNQEELSLNFAEVPGLGETTFTSFPYKVFMNTTTVGTRSYTHRYLIFAPGGNGTYGVTAANDIFETSSFELDGRIIKLPFQVSDGTDGAPTFSNEEAITTSYPVSNDTYFSKTVDNDSEANYASTNFNCLDKECNVARESTSVFQDYELIMSEGCTHKRISEKEYMENIKATYESFAVPAEIQVPVPMTKNSLNGMSPSEEQWCKFDPSCAPNPYKEPTTPVKAGVIAGFTIGSIALLLIAIAAGVYVYNKQQAKRYRNAFAARVAQTMSFRIPASKMDATALANEFKKIDAQSSSDNANRRASAVGNITKQGMWEFLTSGKAVEMNRHDFEALWSVMDADGSGYVDFLEFCAFMGQCHDEYDDARGNRELMAERLSSHLSKRGLDVVDEEEPEPKDGEDMDNVASINNDQV